MTKHSRDKKKPTGESGDGKASPPAEKSSWISAGGMTRHVVVLALAIAAACYQLSHIFRSGDLILASKELLSNKVQHEVPCSKDYEKEKFTECIPRRCGGVVIDNLVSREDAEHLLRLAKRGLSYGGSKGGASILDLHTGALSKEDKFVNIYKIAASDETLFSEEDFKIYRRVKNQIHQAIADEFGVPAKALYLTKPTFFSRMDTTPAHTIHDEYWHVHVDKETYGSFHYTSLLYLSTYKEDFLGGRFIFVDGKRNKTVEPRIGRVSFFTSGSENPHFVEQLKDGVRFAITVSFTCDPKQAIVDPRLPDSSVGKS